MASTYVPIATYTVPSAQSSVTFNSFSGYTDLRIVMSAGSSAGPDEVRIQFNGDTGTNYSATMLRGDGTSAISARTSNANYITWVGYIGTTTGGTTSIFDIMNYANTSTYKTLINRGSLSTNFVTATVGLWRSTSAITSLSIFPSVSTFNTGSTFTLYGIKAA